MKKNHQKAEKEPCDFKQPYAKMTDVGRIMVVCQNKDVNEWKSLQLVGKFAQNDTHNEKRDNYNKDHSTEEDIGLELEKNLVANKVIPKK